MVALTESMQTALASVELFPFATVDRQGVPNVVPVKFVRVHTPTELWITDNFFNKTLNNLQHQPQAALYVWAADVPLCLQIKGQTQVLTSGADFSAMQAYVHTLRPDLPAKSLVVLQITSIFDCMPGPGAGLQVL